MNSGIHLFAKRFMAIVRSLCDLWRGAREPRVFGAFSDIFVDIYLRPCTYPEASLRSGRSVLIWYSLVPNKWNATDCEFGEESYDFFMINIQMPAGDSETSGKDK